MGDHDDFVSRGEDLTNSEDGKHLLHYFQRITEAEPQTDERGEVYIDLAECGAINDQNLLRDNYARKELWEQPGGQYPQLRGRQVIFDFARPLFDHALSALQKEIKMVVLITGTPGVGKSALRNIHAHFLFREALLEKRRCCVLFAKSGKDKMIRFHLEANGTYHVELISRNSGWIELGYPGFKMGYNLFILADISGGKVNDLSGPGLIMYSYPNQKVADLQMMKEESKTLGYPILTKDQLCRYTNPRMDLMFERYGGLARLVWGDNENSHKSRLLNKLHDVDGFLDLVGEENYLKGPHRYFYTQLQEDNDGKPLFDLEQYPPSVVPAPRYVVKIVAQKIVQTLLRPSPEAEFGRLHRAVDGILFEEVCLNLIQNHSENVEVCLRNIQNRKRPLGDVLERKNKTLRLKDYAPLRSRKDVDSDDFVSSLDGSDTPFLVVPKTTNFAGIDAVLALHGTKEKNGVYAPAVALDLQMTRAMAHKVSDQGVDILQTIEKRMSSTGSKHSLVFLVPENHFENFKKQEAKSASKQAVLDKLTQYVACIKVIR